MKKLDIGELNRLYNEGESVDSAHCSEIRTNYLLYIGNHWQQKAKNFFNRTEDRINNIEENTKLKISENHIGVCCNRVVNAVMASSPFITAQPYNQNELRDQKDAELCNAVISDGWHKQDFEKKLERMVTDLVVAGEMCLFQYWDPNGGKLIGYEQAVSEDGEPLHVMPTGEITNSPVHVDGSPLPPHPDKKKPKFSGEIAMEIINPADVRRKSTATSMDTSEMICIDKLMPMKEALARYAVDPENTDDDVVKFIKGATGTTFRVFTTSKAAWEDTKDQVKIKHFFFRPCYDYPEGWFAIATDQGILAEGPLPFGIFPVYFDGWLEISTSARFKSKIKDARIPQLELNRLLSQHAYHTLALGDAKVITQMGSKLQKGSSWSGVKEFQTNGPAPVIMPGTGAEWLNAPIERSVQAIYKIFDLDFENQNTDTNNSTDLMASLYKDSKQKQKFSPLVRKVERALIKIWETYIELAKHYYDEKHVIMIAGKREQVNIAEFKNIDESGYQYTIKGTSKDLTEVFGQNANIQMLLQYAGKSLDQRDVARIARMLPFMNQDQMQNKFTLDDENVDSDILAMDRGEARMPRKTDDHDYYIQRLTHRTKQADFQFLPAQVQQMYEQNIQQRQQLKAQQIQEMKALESQMIPTGGALVTCSVHVPDPKKPGSTVQLRVPYEALMDLMKKLEAQGTGQEQLQMQDQNTQSQIAQKAMELMQQHGMGQPAGTQAGPPMPQQTA